MNTLEKVVFSAVNSAPDLKHNFDNCVGSTLMGVCGALGFSGTDEDVSKALHSLVDKGLINKAPGFCDSIFYIKKEERRFS